MKQPTVSVIIPFVDEYAYLHEAVASVSGQNAGINEIILVCNAAELPSPDLLPSASHMIVIHEPVKGSASARNAGLQKATGIWIQFLDVDDLLLPDKIASQMRITADVVVSPSIYQHISGKKKSSKWLANDLWVGLLNSGLGSTSSWIWKRSALLDVNGWDMATHSHQEYELLFRLMQNGCNIASCQDYNTIVRQRSAGSLTQSTHTSRIPEGISLRERMWKWIRENQLETPERRDAFLQYTYRQLRGLYRTDPRTALHIYKMHYTGVHFRPRGIEIPLYGWLYRILGFELTESLIWRLVRLYRSPKKQ